MQQWLLKIFLQLIFFYNYYSIIKLLHKSIEKNAHAFYLYFHDKFFHNPIDFITQNLEP